MAETPPIPPKSAALTTVLTGVSHQQNPPQWNLPQGAVVNGKVTSVNADGTVRIETNAAQLLLKTQFQLGKNAQVSLRLEQPLTNDAMPSVRILTVDGKPAIQVVQQQARQQPHVNPNSQLTPQSPQSPVPSSAQAGELARPIGVLLEISARPAAAAHSGRDAQEAVPSQTSAANVRPTATQVSLSPTQSLPAVLVRPAITPEALAILPKLPLQGGNIPLSAAATSATPTATGQAMTQDMLRPGLQLQVRVVEAAFPPAASLHAPAIGGSVAVTTPGGGAAAAGGASASVPAAFPATDEGTASGQAPVAPPPVPTAPTALSADALRAAYASYSKQSAAFMPTSPALPAAPQTPATGGNPPSLSSHPAPALSPLPPLQPPKGTETLLPPTGATPPGGKGPDVPPATPSPASIAVPAASGQPFSAQAASQLLAQVEAKGLPAGQIAAVVIGKEQSGSLMVQTRLGLFSLPVAEDVPPPGTAMVWQVRQVLPNASHPLTGEGVAVHPALLAQAAEFTRKGSALQELIGVLQQMPLPNAAQVLQRIVPHAGANFTASLFLFISVIRKGDMQSWLGNDVVERLENMGRQDLLQRLGADLNALRGLFNEQPQQQGAQTVSNWQPVFFPVMVGKELHEAQLFTKQNRDRNKKDKGGGTRFVVELSLSSFGPMQMDGLVKKRDSRTYFDLVIRTLRELPDEVHSDVYGIFDAAQKVTGMAGSLTFRHMPEFPVNPLEELEAGEGEEGDGSILA